MHAQLPDVYLPFTEPQASATTTIPIPVDRIVLSRKARRVKLYLKKNRYKMCVSNLSEQQVKDIFAAIQRAGKDKVENFVFEDEHFALSPATKKQVA